MDLQKINITEKQEIKGNTLELFPVQNKKVELNYTGEDISSDGGLLLLKEVEKQIGIIEGISSCINDGRDQRYVQHTLKQILAQRIFQIAAGYEDANDCNDLRGDAILKMCADLLPESDADLSSQPTMSRFENSVSRSSLYRIAECIGQSFVDSYETEPLVVIVDLDDTTFQKEVLQGTKYFNSTMKTLQLKLLKVAAYVKEMKTKIKIEFPMSCPVKEVQTKAFGIFEVLRC